MLQKTPEWGFLNQEARFHACGAGRSRHQSHMKIPTPWGMRKSQRVTTPDTRSRIPHTLPTAPSTGSESPRTQHTRHWLEQRFSQRKEGRRSRSISGVFGFHGQEVPGGLSGQRCTHTLRAAGERKRDWPGLTGHTRLSTRSSSPRTQDKGRRLLIS